MHPFLDHPGPIPFAHRGGAADQPENTMAAFAAAVALGYRYAETDVQATSDDVLLAFHDERLDRATDRRGAIAELPYAIVSRARVAGREPIATLDELLDAWPDLRVNIEPKHDNAVGPLVAAIRRHRAIERVCVASFSMRRLARLHGALGTELCSALGPRRGACPAPGDSPVEAEARVCRSRCATRGCRSSTRGWSARPMPRGCPSTSGRSTSRPTWSACSTSASMA